MALLYESFYLDTPDFNQEDVRRKAMAMVYLLWEYSIYLPISTSFFLSENNPSPVWSTDVENLFLECMNIQEKNYLGVIDAYGSWSSQYANVIGAFVSRYFSLDAEFMENLATVLFLRTHSFVHATKEDISHSKYVNFERKVPRMMELLDYLEVLRDYVCGIGSIGTKGVIHNIYFYSDIIIDTAKRELYLKKKKQKEELN